jgi:hypothetical protein
MQYAVATVDTTRFERWPSVCHAYCSPSAHMPCDMEHVEAEIQPSGRSASGAELSSCAVCSIMSLQTANSTAHRLHRPAQALTCTAYLNSIINVHVRAHDDWALAPQL